MADFNVLPAYSYDILAEVSREVDTGQRTQSGEAITKTVMSKHWLRQMPIRARESVVWIADGSSDNPSLFRTRWLPGVQWKVGDRFTVSGVLWRVLGVQPYGRRGEIELFCRD